MQTELDIDDAIMSLTLNTLLLAARCCRIAFAFAGATGCRHTFRFEKYHMLCATRYVDVVKIWQICERV